MLIIETLISTYWNFRYIKDINAGASVDFLYRDGNALAIAFRFTWLAERSSIEGLSEYGAWMARLLEVYLSDSDPLEIRVLDDMLRILLGGSGTKEGLGTDSFG